jgi:hypothetical protein
VRLGTHHTSRILLALALGIVSSLSLSSSALGAWSGATQVTGYSQGENVVAGIDDDGTQQLGFLAPGTGPEGQGLYNLTRAPGVTAWTSKRVFGPINNGRFALARNGAAVAAWRGSGETVFAAYKPAGKAWGSPAQIDNPEKLGEGPIPVISAKGAAAVVWSRKSAVGVREPDQIMYSATATGTWSALPSLLAPIEVAQPADPAHFSSCLAGFGFVAAMLPDGKPIVAWNDVYGSYKQSVTAPPGENELGVCGVKVAAAGSSPIAVAPSARPGLGWGVTPSGALPFWYPTGLEVDPVSGRTALTVRGNDDSVTDSCAPQEVDYCFNGSSFQTRVSLGTGAAITHPGTLTANLARVSLRNGFVAAATGSPAALEAGVGTGFPTLAPLSPSAPLTNAAIAVGGKGEAQLILHDGSKFIAYAADAGAQFGAAAELQTGSAGKPSVAIGCNGDALAAWNRGANGLFAATNPSGAAQCEASGPGSEEPGTPGGGGTTPTETPPPAAASGGASTTLPAPTPPAKKPVLRCRKGFQKKTVHGKAKCVKKAKKGKRRR